MQAVIKPFRHLHTGTCMNGHKQERQVQPVGETRVETHIKPD